MRPQAEAGAEGGHLADGGGVQHNHVRLQLVQQLVHLLLAPHAPRLEGVRHQRVVVRLPGPGHQHRGEAPAVPHGQHILQAHISLIQTRARRHEKAIKHGTSVVENSLQCPIASTSCMRIASRSRIAQDATKHGTSIVKISLLCPMASTSCRCMN